MSPSIEGPRGSPIWGVFPAFRKDPLDLLAQTARTFGPLARLPLGRRPSFLISNPSWIEEVLVRKHASFAKLPGLQLTDRILGHGLLTSEGAVWQSQRQRVQPAFHHDTLRAHGAMTTRTALEHIQKWPRATTIDAARLMARLALDVAARTLLGTDMTTEVETVTRTLDAAMADFERRTRSFLALPPTWPTPANRALGRIAQRLHVVIDVVIDGHRLPQRAGTDLVSTLLGYRDESGAPLPRRQLRDEVMAILLAGHETTANALAWSLFLLARHPDVRERMAAEHERPPLPGRHVLGGRGKLQRMGQE